jgi:serine/threonine protein kinase/Leucine-rich repeat (LRR) protein
MNPEPRQAKAIFLEAVEKHAPDQWPAFLDRACAGQPDLRRRVEVLLEAHREAGTAQHHPAVAPQGPDSATTGMIGHEGGPATADEVPLGFLAPPTRPDALGRIGHYEVLQVLGRGGFGIVFRAFDEMLQRVVALKVMAPQLAATSPARKRFLREARSSAQVRHENVVQVYEVAEQPLPYLAMEFIPGETLQQKLNRVGPLDVPEVLRIGRQIAEGLAAAHATDLIHRDIKPGNVLLEGGQQKVKITDFGLARTADDASILQSGIIAGTPMYMAPEQALGQTLDQRADLFSLGSVLYQMVAGRPPFRANGMVAVLKRVAEDTPRPIREIIPETPQWLCDIIAKLHAKDPDDRYQSAREVADVLADCEAQLKANAKLKDFSRIPRRKSQRSGRQKWLAAAAVALLPLLGLAVTEIAGVTHLFRGQPPTSDTNKPGSDSPALAPFTDAGVQRIAALTAEEQVEEVRKELMRRNPGFDGKVGHKIEDGVVTEIKVVTDKVTDISPIRVFNALRVLDCSGTPTADWRGNGQLADLTPLHGMTFTGLTHLDLNWTKVGDASLAQFKDCKDLSGLGLHDTQVSDVGLAYLNSCKNLANLTLGGSKVSDKGLAYFTDCKNLTVLNLDSIQVSNEGLAYFKGCKKLTHLNLNLTRVNDVGLAYFKGCNDLIYLQIFQTEVSDAGLVHFKDCKNLTELVLYGTQVTDSGLAYFKDCNRLTHLNLGGTQVGDAGLANFKGMPLRGLWIDNTGITDLTPLQGMPLKDIRLTPKNITRGLDILRDMKSLRTIGIEGNQAWPAAEFWERYDKGEFN